MRNEYDNGIVYHIDMELIRKTREKDLQKQIALLNEKTEDAQRDLMLIKTAETALERVQDILRRMRGLAVEAAGNTGADRAELNRRLDEMKREIDETVKSATFDGVNLLDGSMGGINKIIAAINAVLDGTV